MKLEGVRVLDLSLFLPGPFMTQMMADQGADVIKLEPANGGEPNRDIGPRRDGVSVYFANTHRNKRSIQVNLKSDAGRELALRLADRADVIVEAFRPGVIKRLGLDYDTVRARHPAVVYASLSAFGQTGPYSGKPAHDLATEAYAGILSATLGFDGKPAIPAIPVADMLTATMGLSAVLMALLRRERTGQGDYVDLAMMDSLIAAVPNSVGSVFAEGKAPVVKNERTWGGYAMYNIYETSDGRYIVLGASEMHFAEAVLTKMARPDLIPLCAPPPGPNQEPVREFFRETFARQPQAYWVDWFRDVDAAFAPVNDLREAMDDVQVRARDMVVADSHGREHLGIPIKFRHEPGHIEFQAPTLGEHNESIALELGYSAEEIRTLRQSGAFGRL
ncbi:MAG: CaiB/BaiF CoA-transferase family protein [Proteobacteria bacterium]|jgi:crotonobetainyl-CoA:carnitine CoA-transferase CaiB-like acyl-CoA transferase|nr:CaiB/BaiF CoA-transferase family protein [Pseudomonadota bacterium]MDA1300502.1 CaiB/BaiF CoA-transferase family protein [Pseudomonadota bacterium]